MKQAVAIYWAYKLKSGKYKKGFGCLKNKDNFCVLGVLCDISKVGEWKPIGFSSHFKYNGSSQCLPKQVKEWSGVRTTNGELDGIGILDGVSLARHNDRGMSFDQLANIILEKWEQL